MNKKDVKFLLPFAAMLLFSDITAMKLQWPAGLNDSSTAVQIAAKIKRYNELAPGKQTQYRSDLAALLRGLYDKQKKKLNDVMQVIIAGGEFKNVKLAVVLKSRKDTLDLLSDIANAGFTKVDNWKTLISSEGKNAETDKFWKNFAGKYNGEDKDSLNAALNAQDEQQKQQAQATIQGANDRYTALEQKVNVYSAENKPTQEQHNTLIGEIDAQIAALTNAQKTLGDNSAKTAIDQLNTLKVNFNGFGIKQKPDEAGGDNTLQQLVAEYETTLNDKELHIGNKEINLGDGDYQHSFKLGDTEGTLYYTNGVLYFTTEKVTGGQSGKDAEWLDDCVNKKQ